MLFGLRRDGLHLALDFMKAANAELESDWRQKSDVEARRLGRKERGEEFAKMGWWVALTPAPTRLMPIKEIKVNYLDITATNVRHIVSKSPEFRQKLLASLDKDWWELFLKKANNDAWWWTYLFKFDGAKFSRRGPGKKYAKRYAKRCAKRRAHDRIKLKALAGVWLDPSKTPPAKTATQCPWIIYGFSTNGVALHVKVKRRDGKTHSPIIGLRELTEKDYDGIKRTVRVGVGAPVGCYKSVKMVGKFDGKMFRVVDPGQINTVSFQSFKLDDSGNPTIFDDWSCVSGEDYREHVAPVELDKYDGLRRERNPKYKEAIQELAKYQRGSIEWSSCVAEYFDVLCAAKFKRYRRVLKMRQKERKQSGVARMVNKLTKDVEVLFFGKAPCRSRGRRICPVKDITRAASRVCAVVPINEWGTSSRCPECKDHAVKVKRKDTVNATPKELFSEPVSPPFSPQESMERLCRRSVPRDLFKERSPDTRIERCTKCQNEWAHDKISTINMINIGVCMLKNTGRPRYLCSGSAGG